MFAPFVANEGDARCGSDAWCTDGVHWFGRCDVASKGIIGLVVVVCGGMGTRWGYCGEWVSWDVDDEKNGGVTADGESDGWDVKIGGVGRGCGT